MNQDGICGALNLCIFLLVMGIYYSASEDIAAYLKHICMGEKQPVIELGYRTGTKPAV